VDWVPVTVALLVFPAALALLGWRLARRRRRSLREEFAQLSGLPTAQAYESLERRVEELMKGQPGRRPRWYLERAVAELRRDKQRP
jgi:hypothetical protein